jgi:hypothetical protein
LSVEYLLQVAAAARVRMPKQEAAADSLEKLQLVGVIRGLLEARSHREMRSSLVATEQLMLVAVAVVIGVVAAVVATAAVVADLRTLMQVYLVSCTLRRIRLQLEMVR